MSRVRAFGGAAADALHFAGSAGLAHDGCPISLDQAYGGAATTPWQTCSPAELADYPLLLRGASSRAGAVRLRADHPDRLEFHSQLLQMEPDQPAQAVRRLCQLRAAAE